MEFILSWGEAIATASSVQALYVNLASCTLPTSGRTPKKHHRGLENTFRAAKSVVVLQGHQNVTKSQRPSERKKNPMAAFYEMSPKYTSISYL